tara:strand:- start:465 stop:566 length:102 start_codon:yes stop_codon:yes gene_type:complete
VVVAVEEQLLEVVELVVTENQAVLLLVVILHLL